MSSLKLLYKLTRLRQCFIAAISTWLITLLNDGDSWFTSENIFPALCLFFSCLGANLFHYGMKWRIYQEKYWDPVIIRRPHLLKIFGLSSFVVAGVIATIWIDSTTCFIFLGLFFLVILFYPITLDRQWPWKNLSIAFCCLSPVVIGYTASNPGENLLAWNIACVVFFVYLASEIIKDIDDQPVDRGRRITMVMVIGEPRAVRISLQPHFSGHRCCHKYFDPLFSYLDIKYLLSSRHNISSILWWSVSCLAQNNGSSLSASRH